MRNHDAITAFLAERSGVSRWDGNHCAAFCAAAVEAQTRRNPMRGLDVRTPRGAARTLKRLGGMERAVSAQLARIPRGLAKRGDIAGVPDKDFGLRLMLIEGATLVAPGEVGYVRVPRGAMTIAWSAG